MAPSEAPGRITAVLGPTNTGKTHFAIERMLRPSHRHDRLSAAPAGARESTTGSSRSRARPRSRWSPARSGSCRRDARYFVCTVEAMPLDRDGRLPRGRRDPARRRSPSAATSSPTGCCMRAAARRPCSWAPTRIRPLLAPAGARGRDHHPAALLDARPMPARKKLTRLPRRSRRRRLLGRRGLRARRADAPPARRRRGRAGRAQPAHAQRPGRAATRPARSITWSRPTPSAWASTWISTMSPSPPAASSTGAAPRRLTAAEMAQIAGRAGRHMNDGTLRHHRPSSGRSTPSWSRRSRITASIR